MSRTILLIEDDFYVRGLYKKAFEMAGYQVEEAEDGESGLKKLGQGEYKFVILDLMLPGIPGLEVLKRIKEDHKLAVYILTNVGDEQVLKEAMASGAESYFVKVNYTPKQLVANIEKSEEERTKPAPSEKADQEQPPAPQE
jgi:two-component system response regulator ResD